MKNRIKLYLFMFILLSVSVNASFFERVYLPPPLMSGNSSGNFNFQTIIVHNLNVTGTTYFLNDSVTFIHDSDDENHHLNVDLTNLDRIWSNLLKTETKVTTLNNASGWYANITPTEYGSLTFNVAGENGKISAENFPMILKLYNGTSQNPILNRIYINNSNNPAIIVSDSEPIGSHVMVARILVGTVTEQIYGAALVPDNLFGAFKKLLRLQRLKGLFYLEGFNISANTTDLSIGTGKYISTIENQFSNANVSLSSGFFIVKNDGSFAQYTSLNQITQYSTGEVFGSNKYYLATVGVVPYNGHVRIMLLISRKPKTEYTSIITAEVDNYHTSVEHPTQDFLKTNFLPIAKIIVNSNSDLLQYQSNEEYYEDIRLNPY